jgi:hypothetical protein
MPILRYGQHDRSELVQPPLLFLDQELRVTDDVDEQDMPNLKTEMLSPIIAWRRLWA